MFLLFDNKGTIFTSPDLLIADPKLFLLIGLNFVSSFRYVTLLSLHSLGFNLHITNVHIFSQGL